MPFPLRLRAASVRTWLGQRRVVRRSLALCAAGTVGVVLVAATTEARAVQERWGDTVQVIVAADDFNVGERIGDDDVIVETRPLAFVPADAITAAAFEVDTLVRPMRAGEVVTERDLRIGYDAFTLEDDQRAVSIPLDPSVPQLTTGDEVDVFVLPDAFGGLTADVEQLASIGVVVDVDEVAVTLAIDAVDVAALAKAASGGQVVLALRGAEQS